MRKVEDLSVNRLYNDGSHSYTNKDEENQLCYKSHVSRAIQELQTQWRSNEVIKRGQKVGRDDIWLTL